MRKKKQHEKIDIDELLKRAEEPSKKEDFLDVTDFLRDNAPEEEITKVNVSKKDVPYLMSESYEDYKETLNEEQAKVFDSLVHFLSSNKKYVTLIGYAGTGKTYTLSKFVEATTCKVAMTAPTNKAVKVLMDNRTVQDDRVTYTTIHKLLALKMQWVYPKGNEKFQPYQKLVANSRAEKTLRNYDLIIIDESSMLDDELFIMIDDELKRSSWDDKEKETKIVFMGDPAQIPPVNREDSIPLMDKKRSYYDIDAHFLERIMRQSGDNKILETAYQIRNNRFMPGDPILSRLSNKDVLFLASSSAEDQKMFFDEIRRHFASKEFENDPNYCKVIAWTNAVVDGMNTFIRQEIFHTKELTPIMKGEKLIADKPIIKGETIIFNTSDEFEVVSFVSKVETFKMPDRKKNPLDDFLPDKNLFGIDVIQSEDSKGSIELHYWETVVKYRDVIDKTERTQSVDILDEKSAKPLSWVLARLFKAKMYREYTQWTERFARVKYNYAITAHKSQGSTYGTVFLIEDDINKNPKLVERNRIKYTASTRPKKRLFMLSALNRSLKEQLNGKKK